MPLKFGSTTVANVDYVDMEQVFMIRLDKVIYNGTTVFERQKKLTTVTENVEYTYYYSSGSSGASFRYPSASLQLSNTPVKVTKIISNLPGGGSSTISSSGLSGTMSAYLSTGMSSSYTSVPWSVSGSKLNISAAGGSGTSESTVELSITYQYYA
ncbi:MAG: hypothetical protein MJZ37_00730 [Bacilli bacterium]|nr:hypothetical protein [Bacilli bacterium]